MFCGEANALALTTQMLNVGNTADFLNTFSVPSDRLMTIDESASILSDISYDKTDDSVVSTLLCSII